MHARCNTSFPALIDKLLFQTISSRKTEQLTVHLKTCTSCQQRYNKIMLTHRFFQGGPDALTIPSAGELARVRQRVFNRLGKPQRIRSRWAEFPRWVAALATTAAAMAIMVPLLTHEFSLPGDPTPALPGDPTPALPGDPTPALPGDPTPALPGDPTPALPGDPTPALPGDPTPALPGDPTPREQYQKRGSTIDKPRDIQLRTFCIHEAGEHKVIGFSSLDDQTRTNHCGLSDVLRFAYTNRSTKVFLFLVGLDAQYQIKWYAPHPPQKMSIPVQTGVVDQTLERTVKLAVNHQAGAVRIFALFSDDPLSMVQIAQGVEQARAARIPLAKLKSLALEGVEQQSILLGLTP